MKNLLEEEKNANKKSTFDRLKLQNIIRFGKDALAAEERLVNELKEKLDEEPTDAAASAASGITD